MQFPSKEQTQRLLKEYAVSLTLELAVAAAIRQIRRPAVEADVEEKPKHGGLLRHMLGGMLGELSAGAMEEIRWQRRRASAAIDRAAARESVAPRRRALPVIPAQRDGSSSRPVRPSVAKA